MTTDQPSTSHSPDFQAGFAAGYERGITTVDDAVFALAKLRPSRGIDAQQARERRGTYAEPAKSAEQIRAEAYASWGLVDPQVAGAEVAAETSEQAAPAIGPSTGAPTSGPSAAEVADQAHGVRESALRRRDRSRGRDHRRGDDAEQARGIVCRPGQPCVVVVEPAGNASAAQSRAALMEGWSTPAADVAADEAGVTFNAAVDDSTLSESAVIGT